MSQYRSACVQLTLILLTNSPKVRESDVGNWNTAERSREAHPLSEKVTVLDLIRKEKMLYAEVAKTYGKNESSVKF